MPTTRRYLRRSHRKRLNHFQMMELWLGPRSTGSAFRSDEERKEAWVCNRDQVMQLWGKGGRRPQGWWYYEAAEKGLRYPGYEYERSVLWETLGVLTEQERAELEREWRHEFDRCWNEPNFSHCAGPDKIYHGDEARVRHLAWADVPPALVDLWLAERERALVA